MKTLRQPTPVTRILTGSIAAACAVALLGGHSARAITYVWDDDAANELWSDLTNWNLNTAAPGTGDTAIFSGAGGAIDTIDLTGGVTIGTIQFDTAAAAYTIGSGAVNSQTLTLDDGGAVAMTATVANHELFNANVLLGTATVGSYTFTNDSPNNSLTFAGGVQGGTGGTAAAKTLTVTGSGNTAISGIVANGGATSLALTKTGTGVLTVSSANTYTGVTTVSGGVLRLDHATALPGGIAVAGGTSALTFNGGVLGLGAGDFTRSLGTAGTVTAVNFTGAGGWAAYGADRVVNLGGAAATVVWATANTGFNGQTLILGAASATHMVDLQNALDLGGAVRTVQVDNGAAAVDGKLSGVLSNGSLTKTGLGTLVLSNTGNSYTGATTVNSGTLKTSANNVLPSASNVTVSGDAAGVTATLDLNGNNNTIGTLSFGGSTTTSGAAVTTGAGTLTLGGDVTYAATNNPLGATISGNLALGANRIFTINDSFSAANDLTVSAIVSGAGFSLTKAGTGTMSLTGANTYTGGTFVNSGTLSANAIVASSTTALGTGAVFIASSATLNVNSNNLATTVSNTVTGSGLFKMTTTTGSNAFTANNLTGFTGTVQLSRTGALTTNWTPTASTYNFGVIIDDGATINPGNGLTFIKGITFQGTAGNPTLSISHAGTFGGNITLNGNVQFGSGTSSGGTGGGAIVAGNIASGAASGTQVLYLYNASTFTRSENFSGNISDGLTGGKISVASNNGGNDNLAILSGFNTYTGETTGKMGILRANEGFGLSTGSNLNITGRHTFETSANLVRVGGTGAGQMQINGDVGQTDAANGFNSVGAPVVVAFGTLGSPTALTWGSGNFNPETGGTQPNTLALNKTWPNNAAYVPLIGNSLDFRNPINLGTTTRNVFVDYNIATLSGVLSGTAAGGFTKSRNNGAGTLVLSGDNTYAGKTSIQVGTLSVASLNNVTGGSANSNLGAPNNVANGTIDIGTSTTAAVLRYTGTGQTTDRVINLAGTTFGATLDQSGTGNLIFTSDNSGTPTFTAGGVGAKSLTLQGSTTGTGEIAAQIVNSSSGNTSLVKTGAGKWTLSGASGSTYSYSGGTTVTSGTLLLSGTANMPSTGTLSVGAGGNFSLADGTARSTSTAALSLAALSNLTFDWTGNATVDTLTSTGAAVTVAGNVGININPNGVTNGDAGGTLISSGSGLNTATYFIANNTNFTSTLTQSATAVTIGTYATASALTDAYWNGGVLTNALASMGLSSGTSSNWASDATGTSAGGVVPGGSAVNVIFGASTRTLAQNANVTLGGDMTLGSVTFNDGGATAITLAGGGHNVTLNSTSTTAAATGGSLATVTAGSAISVTSFATSPTISANILLGASQTWNVAATKTLTVSGTVAGGASNSLTIAGGGTVTLSGAPNAFLGAVTVDGTTAGTTLKLGNAGALGNGTIYTSGVTVNNNATLDLGGITTTAPYGLTLNGSGNANAGALINSTGTGTYYGQLTLGSASRLVANNPIIIDGPGVITGATFGLTLDGTNTGASRISSIIGTTSGTLTKVGSGTWTLTSPTNTYAGQTSIQNGILSISYLKNVGAPGSTLGAPTTVANGTIDLGDSATTGQLTYTGVGDTTDRVMNLVGTTGGGIIDQSGTGLLKFTSNFTATGSGAKALTLQGSTTGLGEISSAIGDSASATSVIKTGAGVWTLSGQSTYTGGTTLTTGRLQVGSDPVGAITSSALGTGTLTFNAGGISSDSATPRTIPNAIVFNNSGILGDTVNTGKLTFSAGVNLGNAVRSITVNSDAQFDGIVTSVAGGGFTKLGAGTLTLTNAETYLGLAKISGGRLILSGNNSAATGGLTIDTSITAIAQFESVNAIPGTTRNVTVTSPGSASFGSGFGSGNIATALLNRVVANSTGAIAIDNYTGTNFDFNTAGLTAASLGSIGNLTYTGTYTPNATGGYRLGGAGGTLTLPNPNALTGLNAVNVTGSVILAGANNVSGITTVTGSSTLTLGTGVTSQNGSVGSSSVVNNGTLVFINFDNQSFAAAISGTGPLTKIGAGNLTLTAQETYAGTTTLNAGTLTLGGGNNTLAVNKTLVVNGGTLDLGSNSQYVGNFTGTGGIVTGTGGIFTTNAANGTYAGSIQGSLNFVKAGANTLTLTADNTTSGTINVLGAGLTLKDSGVLSSATGALTINGATLILDNTGTAGNGDRVNDNKAITLNGGAITLNGRASTNAAETIGVVTADTGSSSISAPIGSSGSSQLTMASLTRTPGASILFPQGMTGFGTAGNSSRILANATNSALTGNLAPINNVVPGTIYMVSTDNYFFVDYSTTLGFKQLATTTSNFSTAGATDNVRDGNGVVGADKTINSFGQGNLTFTNGTTTGGTDLLTIGSGMTILTTNTWGTTTARGRITSGTNELFLFKRDANVTPDPVVNTVIVDKNGSTAGVLADKVSLVVQTAHADRGPYVILTAQNLYSGGTFVDSATGQGGIELNGGSGTVVIPAGGLTINNNSVVDMVSFQGQIESSNVVTINGGGMLRLMGTNTLAGIVFNSNGGTTVPTVIPYLSNTLGGNNNFAAFGAKTGTLQLATTGYLTSTPTNVAVSPLIDSGTLDLNGTTTHDITVSALPEGNFVNTNTPLNGLTISSVIANGGFTKKGTGVLNLTGANTFAGQLTVEDGVLNVASVNNVSASGVLGQSALPVILGKTGNQTGTLEYIGGTNSSSKPFTLATGGMGAFQVDTAATTLTLSGLIDGSGGLTKTGPGTLALTNANTHTGTSLVSTGTLALGHINAVQNSTLNTGPAGAQTVTFTVGGTNTYNLGGLSGADNLSAGSNSLSVGSNNENTTFTGNGTATTMTKVGTGTLDLNGASQNYGTLAPNDGTTNVNGTLGTGTSVVTVTDTGGGGPTKLRFGTVSQTLSSLTIGAGSTVIFTSGAASGSLAGGGGKAPGFGGGSAVVPEPGSLGLLLVGALSLLNRRRRQA